MKKLFAILLAVMLFASMATVASAETTTLTTEVPAATYTLNIPADQKIEFGATATNIGNVTVTNASGFAVGKNLDVTITYDAFTCDAVSTTIPFTLQTVTQSGEIDKASGSVITFLGEESGSVTEEAQAPTTSGGHLDIFRMMLAIDSADWGKALAGTYTATITFTCEVVVE